MTFEGRRGFSRGVAGERVFYTPLVAGDEWRIRRGLAEMSSDTRYLRFFSPATSFSDAEVRAMSSPDQVTHVAWAVLALDEPEVPGLGIARMVRDGETTPTGEVAVVMIDRAQRRGFGTVLLCCMAAAAARRGIHVLRATMLAHNASAVEWISSWGGIVTFNDGCWEARMAVADMFKARPGLAAAVAGAVAEVEG